MITKGGRHDCDGCHQPWSLYGSVACPMMRETVMAGGQGTFQAGSAMLASCKRLTHGSRPMACDETKRRRPVVRLWLGEGETSGSNQRSGGAGRGARGAVRGALRGGHGTASCCQLPAASNQPVRPPAHPPASQPCPPVCLSVCLPVYLSPSSRVCWDVMNLTRYYY